MLAASSHVALAPRLWKAGPSTVIARTPTIPGHPRGDGNDILDRGGATIAQRCGQWVGAEVYRQRGALVGFHLGYQRQHGVTGRRVVGARVEDYRRHAQVHTLEQPVELPGCHTGLPDPDQQSADAVAECAQHRRVRLTGSSSGGPGHRKRFDDLPAGSDVTQCGRRRAGTAIDPAAAAPAARRMRCTAA